ncbi:MAG: hypothetical protein J1F33_01540, partial [Clostridiales bacterium]|nr:hypothetical protein [Clostridiales bacterium]
MQKLFTKRNIILAVIIALITAVFALALLLPHSAATVAHAEGNEGGNLNNNFDVSLVMDLNGKDATVSSTLTDSDMSAIETNNSRKFRARRINNSAVINLYNSKHPQATIPAGYYFLPTSHIVDSNAISVVPNLNGRTIDVIALSKTEQARFTIALGNNINNPTTTYTVSFEVKISDTFVQYSSDAGWEFQMSDVKNLLIGSALNADYSEKTPHSGSTHAELQSIKNNEAFELNLGEILKNHSLYARKSTDSEYQYSDALIMDPENTSVMWGLNSVKNLYVESVQLRYITAFQNVTRTNPTEGDTVDGLNIAANIEPLVRATLKLTTGNVRSYASSKYDGEGLTPEEQVQRFWSDTHFIEIRVRQLQDTSALNVFTLLYPVKFLPNEPQYTGISSEHLRLNVKSPYAYDISTGTYYDNTTDEPVPLEELDRSKGKASIIIRPSDLFDYSAPSDWATNSDHAIMRFVTEESDKSVANRLSITSFSGTDSEHPTALKISVLDNRNFVINLSIQYYIRTNEYSGTNQKVSLSVSGFGNYSIRLSGLRGKSEKSINVITSSVFAELIANGYQMTKAAAATEDDLKIVEVEFADNMLMLRPRANGQAKLEFEFTNTSSDVIKIVSEPFSVDINANDFFASFDSDWQAILVIVAAALGGILIIFLIVWLFLRSIHKHKQEEAATQAPVSSYIVKLNSTIAATQAQQRFAAQGPLATNGNQMLLGSSSSSGAPAADPNTLQLASGSSSSSETPDTGAPSTPASTSSESTTSTEPSGDSREELEKLIAKYISDEELLERIFTEKYEPKGMVRRTFFKSKDLQTRELEKEKTRIIERYKSPMPMDEAIRSENELKNADATAAPAAGAEPAVEEEPDLGVINLDFDVDAPLYEEPEQVKDEFSEEKIEVEVSPEEARLNELEKQNERLKKELAELKVRIDKVTGETDKNDSIIHELEEKIAKAEEENEKYAKELSDLEFKLASAKNKDKEKINRDISINEERTARNKRDIDKWKEQLEKVRGKGSTLSEIMAKLNDTKTQKDSDQEKLISDIEKARSDFEAYQDRLAKVKARQELLAKLESLNPMLVTVNTANYEIHQIDEMTAKLTKERDDLKTDIAGAKAQILHASDLDVISDLNATISNAQARLAEIEKDMTKATKRKSELNIELKTSRNTANDFCQKNEIPLEEVVSAEDAVIGNIEFEHNRVDAENARSEAEKAVASAQAVYDDLSASGDDITFIAMEIAASVKDLEDELALAQADLDDINLRMEEASEDDKLMLIVEQGEKADKVEELKQKVSDATADGAKRKMQAQTEYDEKLEAARTALDEANAEFQKACDNYDNLVNNISPLDLVESGSGIISQDQRKIEAENYKKHLEKAKAEAEQARLAADMAQKDAEKVKEDAARAAEEAKEAARLEAEAAEKARLEAEEKARQEAEAAEQARREAEEAILAAQREAEEKAEQARKEAEEAAEKARLEAEEAAEKARKEA